MIRPPREALLQFYIAGEFRQIYLTPKKIKIESKLDVWCHIGSLTPGGLARIHRILLSGQARLMRQVQAGLVRDARREVRLDETCGQRAQRERRTALLCHQHLGDGGGGDEGD